MYEFKITPSDFNIILDCFLARKNLGGVKYFWEISIPDNEFIPFMNYLRNCDNNKMSFALANIDRYKDYQLLYGFSDFEIKGTENTRLFDFKFENDDILTIRFAQWAMES